MRKNLSLAILFIASLFILSAQAFAQHNRPQPTTRVDERVQQTVVRNSRVDVAQWLRISRHDIRDTEILSLSISGQSFVKGELEIRVKGRLIARMKFDRRNTRRTFQMPQNTKANEIDIRVTKGEVFVERVMAVVKERRFQPVPPRGHRPTPPRGPAPRR